LSVFKARGLVLRERESGESDKQLTLFLKERGKLFVTARGARKPNSKYMAGAQLFTYSDFVIFEKGKFLSVAQVDVIEGFYSLRTDYVRLCVANCLAELCDKVLFDAMQSDEILRLLILSLSQLSKGKDPFIAQRAFEFKFYQLSGLEPCVGKCSNCGRELSMLFCAEDESAKIFSGLSFGPDGILCKSCRHPAAVPISPSALKAMQFILGQEIQSIFSFTLDPSSLEQLKRASLLFMGYNFEVALKSMEMLK
jgi:DNA repair protein RecO (recombination protein O)